ncbi:hypothetical protein BamMEX5DRAFT_0338 [Burkholderia ambifaria MEX-5]|uniref:Uncharacterized protein n=1 Tax=Burkholderia ambifaria MEX-5 TaxID=396597 RepID=B1SXS2_9BURK|nr:hypothetical protein BamMEX5DRAFT_0338 [Burkholderia ambifaria MEX-5]
MQQAAAIVRPQLDVRGQVALRDALRCRQRGLELAAEIGTHTAQHEHHHCCRGQAEYDRHREPATNARQDGCMQIVHVHAGHDVPVPRCKATNDARLVDRLIGTRLRPLVLDEAEAVSPPSDFRELVKQTSPRGIRQARHAFAIQLRLDRMHDHHRVRIADREVAVSAIAHRGERLERLLLRIGLRHRVLLRQLVEMLADAVCLRGETRKLFTPVRNHRRPVLPCAEQTDQKQTAP